MYKLYECYRFKKEKAIYQLLHICKVYTKTLYIFKHINSPIDISAKADMLMFKRELMELKNDFRRI